MDHGSDRIERKGKKEQFIRSGAGTRRKMKGIQSMLDSAVGSPVELSDSNPPFRQGCWHISEAKSLPPGAAMILI
jgi:hypothetical protein